MVYPSALNQMFTIKAAISDGQTKTLMDDGHTRRAWLVSKF